MLAIPWLLSLCLLLGTLLPAAAQEKSPAVMMQELAAVITELQDNTKDLRRNITHWQKIALDAELPAAEKKQWHQRAQDYLQECLNYSTLLAQVDVKKIPDRAQADHFLAARRTFQQELLFFQELLQQPISAHQQTGR